MVSQRLRLGLALGLMACSLMGFAKSGLNSPLLKSGVNAEAFIQRVVDLTNAERAKIGLAPLTRAASLEKSSAWMAQDMADNNYFEHTDRLGRSIGKRMTSFGYEAWTMVGENIAAGCKTPEEVVEAWMQSPGHRENILRPEFTEVGIGFVVSEKNPYHYFWVQDFGKR